MSDNDCILFIDDEMAKYIIAYTRSRDKKNSEIATILGISKGQEIELNKRAVAVGIILQNNEIAEIAMKCVNAIINNHVKKLKD